MDSDTKVLMNPPFETYFNNYFDGIAADHLEKDHWRTDPRRKFELKCSIDRKIRKFNKKYTPKWWHWAEVHFMSEEGLADYADGVFCKMIDKKESKFIFNTGRGLHSPENAANKSRLMSMFNDATQYPNCAIEPDEYNPGLLILNSWAFRFFESSNDFLKKYPL